MPTHSPSGRQQRGPFQTALFRYSGNGAWHPSLGTHAGDGDPVTVTFLFDPDD